MQHGMVDMVIVGADRVTYTGRCCEKLVQNHVSGGAAHRGTEREREGTSQHCNMLYCLWSFVD